MGGKAILISSYIDNYIDRKDGTVQLFSIYLNIVMVLRDRDELINQKYAFCIKEIERHKVLKVIIFSCNLIRSIYSAR